MNDWITIKEITEIKPHYSGKAWVLVGKGRSDLRNAIVDFMHVEKNKSDLDALKVGMTIDQRI
ncbi:hypothetical protein [Serratia sp. Se-RSBMAAmG]|uniref:hypothetical protein n=1 Tax=Serratia sp. Se-RSBMAAmG TaxID=3043305 RepID=UPI0024AE8E1A|nr:hypothetical protein [Serratia sp. Se-RSBMAAmG]MDI6976552.1 hypothetical protein [Serratia sp. Se-RSBMAAmG]